MNLYLATKSLTDESEYIIAKDWNEAHKKVRPSLFEMIDNIELIQKNIIK